MLPTNHSYEPQSVRCLTHRVEFHMNPHSLGECGFIDNAGTIRVADRNVCHCSHDLLALCMRRVALASRPAPLPRTERHTASVAVYQLQIQLGCRDGDTESCSRDAWKVFRVETAGARQGFWTLDRSAISKNSEPRKRLAL